MQGPWRRGRREATRSEAGGCREGEGAGGGAGGGPPTPAGSSARWGRALPLHTLGGGGAGRDGPAVEKTGSELRSALSQGVPVLERNSGEGRGAGGGGPHRPGIGQCTGRARCMCTWTCTCEGVSPLAPWQGASPEESLVHFCGLLHLCRCASPPPFLQP